MAEQDYDAVVIGGGPGGYVCAIRLAQLGFRTACVESRTTLGGTCLNVGCIPSKALLHSSHHYAMAGHAFAEMGIRVGKVDLDLKTMMARKAKIVDDLTKGIGFLFKKNKIDWLKGTGSIPEAGKVAVKGDNGKTRTVSAEHIVIATGSAPNGLPGLEIDEATVVSSTGALEFTKPPKHLAVIGGGIIGLELGSVWRRLGSEVTVIEYLDHLLPPMDADVQKDMLRILKRQGLAFRLGMKVTGAKVQKTGAVLLMEPVKGGDAEELKADKVLVAIGRRPYTDGLGLDTLGVKTDKAGFVEVDKAFRTSVAGVYAIGDVIGGKMLAHKAEDEGMVLAEMLAGQKPHLNYDAIPAVMYTWPEVASVGKTERELKDAGIDYRIGKFPMMANSRARTMSDTDGFVKILADARTDRILGAHIIAANAGPVMAELGLAMEFSAAAEDVARTTHSHPDLGEAVKEAALSVEGRAIHI